METNSGTNKKSLVHIIVYFVLTFGIGLIPAMGITQMGMKVFGVFIGLLYGWTCIGFAWPSMFSIVVLGFTGYDTPANILATAFSNPTVIFTILVLTFTAYCDKAGLNLVMSKWLLSRKAFIGRPWIFTASVFIGTLIIGFLLDGIAAVFLISSILYSIFTSIGYKAGDNYPAFALAGVCIAGVLSYGCKPWAGQNLNGIVALEGISKGMVTIPYMDIIIVCFPICIITLLVYTLIIKWIFKPDITLLKNLSHEFLETIRREIIFGAEQKVAAFVLVIFLLMMLLPSILPKDHIFYPFIGKFTITVALTTIFAILSFVKINGTATFDFQQCAIKGINWNVIWMLAAAIPVSSAISSDGTGINLLLTTIFSSFISDGNIMIFLLVFMVIANLVTQITHNVTVILVGVPIMYNICQITNINPIGACMLLFIAASAAFATPAASTVGALSFANGEWIGMLRAFKAGIFGWLGALFVMLIVGIPLVVILVGI